MKSLRRHKSIIAKCMLVLLASWQVGQPLQAATYYWDTDGSDVGNSIDGTNLGGTGTWDTVLTNWWDGTNPLAVWPNLNTDTAVFTGTAGTVTLGSGLIANGLSFRSNGYLLTGGDLTLGGTNPGVSVDMGMFAAIASQLSGVDGFIKSGRGTLKLTNATNNYTGTTSVSNGVLVISDAAALGSDTSAVVVSGSATRGAPGGTLVLEGGYSSGVTFTRDLSLQGLGTSVDRGGALISVGDNTISGAVGIGTAPAQVNTRFMSAQGNLTLSGGLNVPGAAATNFAIVGGASQIGGASRVTLTGPLTGTGTLEKAGGGVLVLSPSSASGFSGTIRLSASATTGATSAIRILTPNVLGTRTSTTGGSVLDFNGGQLEVMMDTPLVQSGASPANANVYQRGAGTLFVDHAPGTTVQNGTLTLGALAFEENFTFTFNARNGYNITFGAAPVQGGTNNSTFTNNLNGGTLTFTGAFWSNGDSVSRTMVFGGNGNTTISGNLTASNATASVDHSITKQGTGTLNITSTAATLDGNVNAQNGVIQIADFRSINMQTGATNNGQINIGTAGTTGTLTIGNATAATALGLQTTKTINLSGSTGGAIINANQAGANPVSISSVTASQGGNKTLTLGGTNTANNLISGAIPNNTTFTTSLIKTGPGTWVLSGANSYTGATTISNGTLKLTANGAASTVIADASAITFNANTAAGTAGGTLQFTGVSGTPTTEALGALTPTAGSGTVILTSGGAGAAANLTFASLGTVNGTSTVNLNTSGAAGGTITITGVATSTATTLPGNGHIFINGANFARSNAGVMVTPVYGTDAGFVNAPAALTAANHNLITGSFTSGAVSVSSLKMTNHTLTMSGNLTLGATGSLLQAGGTSSIVSDSGTARLILASAAATNINIRVDGASDVLNIGSGTNPVNIGSAQTGGFTKSGAGKLIFFGTNAQTGTTAINEGTVELNGANARLAALAGTATIVRQNAFLDFNTSVAFAATPTVAALDGAGTIRNVGSTDVTLVQTGAGTWAGTFSETGSGKLNVSKLGTTGAPTWSGTSNYTGVTTIGGTTGLVTIPTIANIGVNSPIGRGDNTDAATNAASLVLAATTGGLSYSGTVSGSTDRLFTLDSGTAGGGGQIANASATNAPLAFTNSGAIVFGPGAIVGQTLTLGGASTADNTFAPQITDNNLLPTSLSKIGAGVWHLVGTSNSYTGLTTITAGGLGAGANNANIPTNSPIVFGGGQLISSGTFTRNLVATATAGNASEVSFTGAGGFAANGDKLIVAIGGLATPTALTWNSGGFVPTGSALTFNSTANSIGEVEFRNAIDLAAGARTIQADDNGSTGSEFATITGVISGATGSGLVKTGSGILQLFGNNTYEGTTTISAGTLTVQSLGNSAVSGPSSIGTTVGANTAAGALLMGNGTTGAGILNYVGVGETSDRLVRMNVTTASNQIHANGSGALILTNVENSVTGAKTLFLRGNNSSGNAITSNLVDNGALGVTIDGGATWILSGNNSFTGVTTVSTGPFGIGHDNAAGATQLALGNSIVFAHGGDRTVNTPLVTQSNNTTAAFTGDYSLTIPNYTNNSGANSNSINNYISAGKSLTIGNLTSNAITASRSLTFNGTGDVNITGNITTSTAFNLNPVWSSTGTLTLSGTASTPWQDTVTAGSLTINSGTLRLGASEVIPNGAGAGSNGNLILSPATGVSATFNLNGNNETINGLTATSAGNITITNSAVGPATLTVGDNNGVVAIGGGSGTYAINNTGGGALSLVKTGSGAMTIGATTSMTYTGSTRFLGGTSTVSAAINGTTGLEVRNSGTIANLNGNLTSPGVITTLVAEGGTTLNLNDGAGSDFANLTTLQLGSTGGTMTTLGLNVGDSATDILTLLTGGTLSLFAGNQVTFNLTDSGLAGGTTYNLISVVDGGLTLGALGISDWLLGATPGGFTSFTLNVTDTLISVTTGSLITNTLYWTGATDNAWNGALNNFSTDKPGTIAAASSPGAGTDVVFMADTIVGGAVSTTLEQNFKINSLTFEQSTTPANTPTSVTIAAGAVATNRLEVAPQVATDGVEISAGGPAAVNISAPFRLGAHQTWTVADAATVLTLSGGLQGDKDVTKAGLGKVTISGAADPTFNTGLNSDFTVNAGTLELTNLTGLGTATNAARVNVATGGTFYYNNATAGTLPLPLTLSGGTLSGGAANHTYSGTVNISGNSFINMRDNASAVVTDPARNITLSGAVSGTGSLTIDSVNTASNGNQFTGTVTLSNAGNTWSGDVNITRGTLTVGANASAAFATNNINFNLFGRTVIQGVNAGTLTRTGTLNMAAAAIAEYQIDNTSGTLTSNYTVDQSGAISLGAGSGLRVFLQDTSSQAVFSGPITLAGNASVSVAGGDADSMLVINSVVSDGGNAYSLAINDDLGGWAQTNTRVQLNAINTHTGGTSLADGILILGNKDALGTGTFTVTGGTLQGSVDLSSGGVGPVANAVVMNGGLTVSGTNNITFGTTLTNSNGNRTLTNSLTGPAALLINEVRLAEAGALAVRTFTVAGAGATTISNVVNNDQNNSLINNQTVNTLMIGSVALSDSALVGRTLTMDGTGLTTVTGLIEDIAGGGGLSGSLTKAGTGTLTLQGANTFTGNVAVNGGFLDFSTVTNISAGASNLGNGTAISLGAGTLRFVGSTNQTTDRPITVTGAGTLSTAGTSGTEISYTGAITAAGNSLTLTGTAATNIGNLSGGITQTGSAADLNVNSGTWNLTGINTFSDDIIVTGATAVLNLNATGTVAHTAGTSNGLYSRTGATINLNANDVNGAANAGGNDFVIVADTGTGAATLDMNTFNFTTLRLDVGQTTAGLTGSILGTGTMTVTTDFNLYSGLIEANLAGAGPVEKFGMGTITLKGDNTNLTSTTAVRIDAGVLELDYTDNNATKLRAATGLDMRGGALTLIGSDTAPTSQAVASLTLASGGSNRIAVTGGSGQTAVLNLGAITRAAAAGTLRVELPSGTQDATNGVITSTAVNAFGTLPGYLTVNDGTGLYFAGKNGTNNIVALASTVSLDASAWTTGLNVTNTGGAYSGTTGLRTINSLAFDNATSGTITVGNTASLDILNGGILLTTNASAGTATITGGRLTSGLTDVVVTHEGAAVLNIASQIGLNQAVTKTGNGVLRLSNTINNFTGATNIQAGTLQVSGGNAIGDTSSVVLADDRQSTLQLLANETIGNLSGGNASAGFGFGTVALGTNNLTIASTASGTYAGVFTGSGSITRNGSSGVGNLLFTGVSGAGYTGALVVNGGLMYVEGAATMDASSLTINKGGSFLISNNGTTRSGTRFLDTMPITLNSADGAWNSEARPSGLAIRTDQNATTNETVGVLTFGSGANYFRGDASGTTGIAGLITSNFVRVNSSTLTARGRNLGGSANDRNFLRIASGTANETAFAGTLVGGLGAAGTKNISIVPWAIGEVTTAALGDANMGNSLMTYVVATGSGSGLRPLDLTTEYNTFATLAGATDNIRESLAADLTGVGMTTINALVVNNSNTAAGTVNVTGNGAGQTLVVTSGTMLFTATAATTGTPAMGVTLGGFDSGISVGGTNEYVIFVQNPTAAAAGGTVTATISSPLSTAADITKSGRGVLVLSGANTAGGGSRKTTLNEGTLEIAGLSNIGGATGGLVFAGGTLRLGAGFVDDISTRTITFLSGGGTIDTNGIDLALAGSLGSGGGGFTKTGAGNLTLNAASTHTGGTTVSGGTVTVGANNATGGGNLTVGAGATLALGANSISHTLVSTTGAGPVITGTGTINASTAFLFTNTVDTTLDAVLAGAGSFFKNQANTLTLNGTSTYTGGTEIQNGTVAVAVLANAGTASSLGAPAAGTDASVIRMGLTNASTGLSYIGSVGASTNRIIALQGTTGGVTLSGNGTGAVDFAGGAAGYFSGAKTLTLSGTSGPSVINRITNVTDGTGVITLAKSGANVWEVYGTSSSYTGQTQVNEGTLQIANADALPVATTLRIGTGATVGTFDTNGFDQTIASLLSQTNSNSLTNSLVVDSGNTFTVTGAVTIGANVDASTTLFAATGGGAFVNNNTGGTFLVGGATGATNENAATADFSGLGSLTLNMGSAGLVRVGDVSTGTGAGANSVLTLAPVSTITAGTLNIGAATTSSLQTLHLGGTTNNINVDTINVGAGDRSSGLLDFAGATGSVQVRGSDGTSRAAFNLINSTFGTGANRTSTVDFTGHSADLLISTLSLAVRTANTGSATATMSFDQGTLDATSLVLASRSSTGTGDATGTLNIAGGTTTIGSVSMAVNTSAGGTVIADMNLSGGTISLGAINMANAGTGRTVTSTLDISGTAAVTLTGNVTRTNGGGTENATINFTGGSLDAGGFSVGSGTAAISFNADAGTLTNLAELNGGTGSGLNKANAGTLTLGNGNTYSSGTTLTTGTIVAANTTGSATGSGAFTSAVGTTLTGDGSIVLGNNINMTVGGNLVVGTVGGVAGSDLSLTSAGTGTIALNGKVSFDIFDGDGDGDNTALPLTADLLSFGSGSTITLGGTLEITNTNALTAWAAGDIWKLFDWTGLSVTGTFSNLTSTQGNFTDLPDLSAFDPDLAWDVSNLYTFGTISVVLIPEPSRAMLLLFGLLALGFRRRRSN